MIGSGLMDGGEDAQIEQGVKFREVASKEEEFFR